MIDKTLTKFDAAKAALTAAVHANEVKAIRDTARAFAAAAKVAGDRSLEANAFELRTRAELKLGQMMAKQKATVGLAKGTRGAGRPKKGGSTKNPPKPWPDDPPTLKEAGIDKNLAQRARTLARQAEQNPKWIDRVIKGGREAIEGRTGKRPRKSGGRKSRGSPYEMAQAGDWPGLSIRFNRAIVEIHQFSEVIAAFEPDDERKECLATEIAKCRAALDKLEGWVGLLTGTVH